MAKKLVKQPDEFPCPSCRQIIKRDRSTLAEHYRSAHGRDPTPGEVHQMKTYEVGGYGDGTNKGAPLVNNSPIPGRWR
jgi:hypothetical protein